MASTLLEQARLLHEDCEMHRLGAVQVLQVDHKTTKDVIVQDATVKRHIRQVVDSSQALLKLYEDADGLRKQELDDMAGDNVFSTFYERLMAIREYHKKFPGATRPAEASVGHAVLTVTPKFSDEEHGGKFLDLQRFFTRYLNLPQFRKTASSSSSSSAAVASAAGTASSSSAAAAPAPASSSSSLPATDYLTYLAKFASFDGIPRWKKMGTKAAEYEQYLNDLHQYLAEFFARANPLVNVSRMVTLMDEDFETRWRAQQPAHWFAPEAPPPTAAQERERKLKERAERAAKHAAALKQAEADRKAGKSGAAPPAPSPNEGDDMDDDSSNYKPDTKTNGGGDAATAAASSTATAAPASSSSSSAAITGVTVDENSPMFCKACKKMFTKQTTFDSHLPGKLHKKAAAKLAAEQAASAAAAQEAAAAAILAQQKRLLLQKQIAGVEDKIGVFADLLSTQLTETAKFVEKKQTSLPEEIARDLQAELEKEQAAADAALAAANGTAVPGSAAAAVDGGKSDSDSDDDSKPIYNPLNLPLDYNGKPIPYWLYKLHGLNIEYKCELCGGYSYWGPRAFERHFKEWRHSYGLRCLGIPNTKEFMNVTRIDDAKRLWDKLSKANSAREFRPDEDEEFEDHDGNVYNKKTYEDLRRQGLI